MRAITPLLLIAAFLLPGCIVQDIYDQIELSNQQLGAINETLAEIERTNELLDSIDTELQSIDGQLATIGEELASVDDRMAGLQVVLDAVSEHLASLRKTINNIDSTIPFLKLSGDDEEEKESLENTGEPTETDATRDSPPSDPATGTPA